MTLEKDIRQIEESESTDYLQEFGKNIRTNTNYSPRERDKLLHNVNVRLKQLGASIVSLALLFSLGCSYLPFGERVLQTITDKQTGFKKEWVDTNGDGRTNLIKTYFICNGKVRSEPSSVYDVRRNKLSVEEHLVRYSQRQNVLIIPGDRRC